MQVHLSPVSSNVKTGPIPVSTTEKASCPKACSLKGNGCYAESGPLGMHWAMVSNGKRGNNWDVFCAAIAKLPRSILWRHNQAGDLAGDTINIDSGKLSSLVKANAGRRGFTYTHYDVLTNINNRDAVKHANNHGFTINLSAESLQDADKLAALDIGPVVTILAEDAPKTSCTPDGRKVIVCPATYKDNVSCATCELCQRQGNRPIIGFPVHGTSKKKAAKVFMIKSI
jgi:hypothetical protein